MTGLYSLTKSSPVVYDKSSFSSGGLASLENKPIKLLAGNKFIIEPHPHWSTLVMRNLHFCTVFVCAFCQGYTSPVHQLKHEIYLRFSTLPDSGHSWWLLAWYFTIWFTGTLCTPQINMLLMKLYSPCFMGGKVCFLGQCSCTFCAALLGPTKATEGRCAAVRQSISHDTISHCDQVVLCVFPPNSWVSAHNPAVRLGTLI